MVTKFYLEDEESAFTLVEEADFFRLVVERSKIEEHHVEEFMDKTVEWLSTTPDKGILIDFKKVSSVCGDFTMHLNTYYEDIKARGLNVRFVNVAPALQPYIDVSNITLVMSADPDKGVISAKEILADLANNLSDKELMQKHGLSAKGLAGMFKKLLRKGLIAREVLAQRMGVGPHEITVFLDGKGSPKIIIDAGEVLKDLSEHLSDDDLMRKYKLSPKGLQSMWRKLYGKGLVSREVLQAKKQRQIKL